MKAVVKKFLDVEQPVLTEKLAPKLAPIAKIVYWLGLVLMVLRLLETFSYFKNFSVFLLDLLILVAEFALLRMFCEYLASTAPKAKK